MKPSPVGKDSHSLAKEKIDKNENELKEAQRRAKLLGPFLTLVDQIMARYLVEFVSASVDRFVRYTVPGIQSVHGNGDGGGGSGEGVAVAITSEALAKLSTFNTTNTETANTVVTDPGNATNTASNNTASNNTVVTNTAVTNTAATTPTLRPADENNASLHHSRSDKNANNNNNNNSDDDAASTMTSMTTITTTTVVKETKTTTMTATTSYLHHSRRQKIEKRKGEAPRMHARTYVHSCMYIV